MGLFRSCTTLIAASLALATAVSAQTLIASNDTSEIPPYESSPRFWINGTDFTPFRIVPLGWYSQISQQNFLGIDIEGQLIHVDDTNANDFTSDAINYLSCDPEDYTGVLSPDDTFRMVATAQQSNSIVLYSTRASHCDASDLRQFHMANGIFSTLDPVLAATVANEIKNESSGKSAIIEPDRQSFMNDSNSSNQPYSGSRTQPGPTTAVAMIILYTITGIITALFVVIIVTGAIRAHRHPERYGPSNIVGRPRRTRAKGIGRAILDGIPIVKFGDKNETPENSKEVDIEMAPPASNTEQDNSKSATAELTEAGKDVTATGAVATNATNPDGTDEAGQLGCSICTEDFNKGEEVRVLPCNHKFHPECVDPWLLNVSGTCPLCRIDLRPKNEQQEQVEVETARQGSTATVDATGRRASVLDSFIMAPPLAFRSDRDRRANTLAAGRRDTTAFAGLRSVASGTREDRIAALRRFRQQMRNRAEGNTETTAEQREHEEEQRGLTTRLRERFRIRTRRQGEEESTEAQGESSTSASRQHRQSVAGMPRGHWNT
ncbi:hypothetical protein OHC33_009486 [Knufia fluminis]|uniref:RING-type E3 ubiquitin transferase n=1 Tax=Knufia fluminis TaxID=191047 RepID=A0AAN8E9B2_9EURO|nr:hypothetical protein OHC33_009486 [Knufia fluminis]